MTESDWLLSEEPLTLLDWAASDGSGPGDGPNRRRLSDRKMRLFACACRRFTGDYDWSLSTDGHPTWGDMEQNPDKVMRANGTRYGAPIPAIEHARLFIGEHRPDRTGSTLTLTFAAALLREITGNPFDPVRLAEGGLSIDWKCEVGGSVRFVGEGVNERVQVVPHWLTTQALSLAKVAYEDRRSDGSLDPMTLLAVADALEEAGRPPLVICHGCETPYPDQPPIPECVCGGTGRLPDPILAHLRSPGPHVRGCWAIDLLLGKE